MCAQSMHTGANSYKIEVEKETKLNETIKSVTLAAVDKPHPKSNQIRS